jgi:tetratricopeptide (TPR) repeat protein
LPTTLPWARGLILTVAFVAYANSLGNGFAYDDEWFIVANPVVTDARFDEAFTRPAWPGAEEGGNYRPITLSSFALEWSAWGDRPFAFHVVSVLAHGAVSLLVLGLLARFVTVPAAFIGGVFFAIHPVHTEAVANVMGRAELYAALAYLGACILYLAVRPQSAGGRAVRLLALVALFLCALGAKEIAVTLPGMLMLLELHRRDERPATTRLADQAPTYVALAGVLAIYVLVRWNVLGELTGESAAAGLVSLSPGQRVLTALTVWPHYARLMVFPLDLASDYGPNVLRPVLAFSPRVLSGAFVLAGAVAGAVALARTAPVPALGLAWFVIAVSPVSNLLVRADVLLAERTLYLPSVGAAFVVAGVAASVLRAERGTMRRVAAPITVALAVLLLARTVDRNPSWESTYTALTTLAIEHPESWGAERTQAIAFTRVGDLPAAAERYDAALEIAPDHYGLLIDAAVVHARMDRPERVEDLLARAIALTPRHPLAYRRLAENRLLRGDGRAAHAIALEGLKQVRASAPLWGLVSESYVAKGDLEAAVRARRVALTHDRASVADWSRLADLLEALDRGGEAAEARRRAAALSDATDTER